MFDPFQLVASAWSTADEMSAMGHVAASEFAARRPGRRSALSGLFRRKKEPEPKTVPGTKKGVGKFLDWAEEGRITINRTLLRLGFVKESSGSGLIYIPGRKFFEEWVSQFDESKLELARKIDSAMRGEPVDLGEGRSIRFKADAPLPTLTVRGEAVVLAWTGAEVQQGRFTAEFRGITIYSDRAEIDVAWTLVGIDLARNPVVWWAD